MKRRRPRETDGAADAIGPTPEELASARWFALGQVLKRLATRLATNSMVRLIKRMVSGSIEFRWAPGVDHAWTVSPLQSR